MNGLPRGRPSKRIVKMAVSSSKDSASGFFFAGPGRPPAGRADGPGLRGADADPAARRFRPLLAGPRSGRAGGTGHGQDGGLRPAAPAPAGRRARASAGRPFALILVPTRELAMQVAEAVHRYGRAIGASVLPIYGGQAYGPQLRALERGVDVVIATPGRALDLIRGKTLKLDGIAVVVLDEADEMLDMGFAEDIEAILAETPKERQTVLFSATLPPRIAAIAKRHLTDPVKIKIAAEPAVAGTTAAGPSDGIHRPPRTQAGDARPRARHREPDAAIVFCRRRNEVDELTENLNSRGYRAEALHGGMTQEQRNRVMKKFRGEAADLLIATDVAARGLDIEHLSHVINYDVPCEAESYVHRIGRVGRAGREGVAITLAEPREHRQIRDIEQTTGQKIDDRQGADHRRPAGPPARADPGVGARSRSWRAISTDSAWSSNRWPTSSTSWRSPWATVKLLHQANGAEDHEEDEIPEVEPFREQPVRGKTREKATRRQAAGEEAAARRPGARRQPRRPDDAALHRRGSFRGRPAAGPGRRDHGRGRPDRPPGRRHRHRRPVLARRGSRRPRRRRHRGASPEQDQGQEGYRQAQARAGLKERLRELEACSAPRCSCFGTT